MSTPLWVTVLVAVLSTSGAVATQFLNNRHADRRDARERVETDRRYERDRGDAEHLRLRGRYARVLAAISAARAASGGGEPELAELRLAAADLEFSAPDAVLDGLAGLTEAVQRWLRLRAHQPEGAPAVVEAAHRVTDGRAAVRDAMRADLAVGTGG